MNVAKASLLRVKAETFLQYIISTKSFLIKFYWNWAIFTELKHFMVILIAKSTKPDYKQKNRTPWCGPLDY